MYQGTIKIKCGIYMSCYAKKKYRNGRGNQRESVKVCAYGYLLSWI